MNRTNGEVLRTTDVTKRFGGNVAVDAVNVQVSAGEIVGLVGPNGSGKSTLLNLLTRVLRPSSGSVELFGRPTKHLGPHHVARRGVHYGFQRTRLLPEDSVEDHVAMALSDRHVWRSVLSQRWVGAQPFSETAEPAIERFHLSEVRHQAASELSFGQRQLLSLCMASVRGARLLLLDEPLAGLSGESIATMSEQVTRLSREGTAVIVVEHRLKSLMAMCARFVAMDRGRVIAEGDPEYVMSRPEVEEAYFGQAVRR